MQVAVATGDIKLKTKTADIQDNGVTIADGQMLGLHLDHAVSTDVAGRASADPNRCSSIDLGSLFNNQFKGSCLAGKCTINSTVNRILGSPIITAGQAVNIRIAGFGIPSRRRVVPQDDGRARRRRSHRPDEPAAARLAAA